MRQTSRRAAFVANVIPRMSSHVAPVEVTELTVGTGAEPRTPIAMSASRFAWIVTDAVVFVEVSAVSLFPVSAEAVIATV